MNISYCNKNRIKYILVDYMSCVCSLNAIYITRYTFCTYLFSFSEDLSED
jgi:hypothetical protein